MKTTSRTPIGGAATQPLCRSAGRWYLNGSGTRRAGTGASVRAGASAHGLSFAPAIPSQSEQAAMRPASAAPASGYGPLTTATSWKTGRFCGQDFPFQPDGTLRCPAGQQLHPHERRREADGSLRVVYAASVRSCRPCPLREQCQWNGGETSKPRQVSVLLHPLVVGPASLQWRDWSRRQHRQACMQLLRHQRVEIQAQAGDSAIPVGTSAPLSRAARAHSRLIWGRAADAQCACSNRGANQNQALRDARAFR